MLRVPTHNPIVRPVSGPGDLAPEIRMALTALADVEARYEDDRESLEGWSGPKAIRIRLLDRLELRHAQERQALVQQLAELYQQTTTNSLFGSLLAKS